MVRRLLLTLALVVPLAVFAEPTTPASAADGLAVSSTTTFTVDAEGGAVRVRAEFTLSNTLRDSVNGTTISRPYFAAFTVPAPASSVNAVAVSGAGTVLRVARRPVPGADDYVLYDVTFASNLFAGESTNVVLTYDITGNPPRSDNPIRVNAAYAAFGAFGIGDEGKVTVRVVVPAGFEVEVLGSDTEVSTENGATVYTATDIADPEKFDLFVSARNDTALTSTEVVTDDGDRFDVRSWPGDDEWQQFVDGLIRSGVPALESLIGQPWPIDDELEVRQAFTPYLFGYAGWFSASEREIEVGEDLDEEVVLHELSHAWFSDTWFSDRWINEGLAQVYAGRVVAARGGSPVAPSPIDPDDPGRVALNDWGDPDFTNGADEQEPYGYNAAETVVRAIADDIGDEAMREVFDAVATRTIAYRGDVDPEPVTTATDWKRFLDLVDEIGGATTADALIEQYVVNTEQAPLLAPRAAARDAYARLVVDGGSWAPPRGVRLRMSDWKFDEATGLIDRANGVLRDRDELVGLSDSLGVTPPSALEVAYETTDDDFNEVETAVQAQIDATRLTLDAVATNDLDHGWFENIGLWGTDVDALIQDAKEALAAGDTDTAARAASEAATTLEDAASRGIERVAITLGALVLVASLSIGVPLLVRRRRVTVPTDSSDDVTQE